MRIKSQTLLCTVLLLLLAQCGWAQFQMRVKGTDVSLGIVPKQYPLTVQWKATDETKFDKKVTISSFGQKISVGKEQFDIQIASDAIYGFAATPDSKNIVNVLNWGDTKWQTLEYAFAGSDIAGFSATDSPNLSECWNMEGTFQDCKKFNDASVAGWDVSHVRNMRNTFKNAEAFNQNLAGWQVQGVNDMSGMFMNAKAFGYELKEWAGRVGNVVSMENTFNGAAAFNTNLGLWKLRSVKKIGISNSGISDKNYAYALQCWNAMELKDVELSAAGLYCGKNATAARTALTDTKGWKIYGDYKEEDAAGTKPFIMHVVATSTSPIAIPVYGRGMKISCKNLENVSDQYIVKSGVNVTSDAEVLKVNPTVGKIYEIVVKPNGVVSFKGNKVGHPFTIKQWGDVKWKSMNHMFAGAKVAIAKEAGIPVMDEVEDCSYMFEGCDAFNSDISSWNVSNVKNMSHMFDGCKNFNNPLNKWNVSKVNNMSGMFKGCKTFNQLINSWNVEAVEDFSNMFEGCEEYNKPLIGWKTTAAVNMAAMFKGCEKFNQPIQFDTKNVKDLREVFSGCKLFNQPLESFDVENVASFADAFKGASSFNQPLGSWKLRRAAAFDLSGTNLNSENYTKTLIAWAAQESICTDLKLTVKANLEYKKESFDAREKLVAEKKWVISSDKAEQVVSSNNSFLKVEKSLYYLYTGTTYYITVTPYGQFANDLGAVLASSTVECNLPEKDKAKVSCSVNNIGSSFRIVFTANEEVEGKVSFVVKRKVDKETGKVDFPDYKLSFDFKAIEKKDIAFTPEMTVVYLRKGERFELPVKLSPADLKDHQRVPALNLVNAAAPEHFDMLVKRVVYDEQEKVKVDLYGFEEGEYTVRMVSAYDPAVKAATFKVVVVPALTKFQLLGDDNITVRQNATENYHIALDMESTSELSKQVEWSCEPKEIAKVYQNGDVKPLTPGFATITLKTFTYPQITKTVHLTVLPAEAQYSVGADHKLDAANPSYTPANVAPGGTILVEFKDGIELNGVLKLSDADKNSGAVLKEIIPHKLYSVLMGVKDVTLDGEIKDPTTYSLKAEVKNENGVSINKYFKYGTSTEYTTEELGKLAKGTKVTVTLNNSAIQITNLEKKNASDPDKVPAVQPVYVEAENCKVEVVTANQEYTVTIGESNAKVTFNVCPVDKYVTFTTAAKEGIKVAAKVVSAFYGSVLSTPSSFLPPLDKLTMGDVVVVSVLEPLDKVYKVEVSGGAELATLVSNKEYAIRLGSSNATFTIDYADPVSTYALDVVDNTGMGFSTDPTELSALTPNTNVTLTVTNPQNVPLELMVEGAQYEVKDNNSYVITVGYQNATVVINKASSLKPNELPSKPENPGINPGGAPGYYPGTAVEDAVFANVVVAPNPFTFMLRVAGVEGRYELISVQGVVLRAGALFETETLVETSDLNAGLYLMRLTATNGATKTFKVVKR